ncbi:MAG TPA: ATP-dependent DNA ligase [Solirubrobacterales bacterium]|nr:ATP-dependent DNA ligase [Solirubrobacterales bacterium]
MSLPLSPTIHPQLALSRKTLPEDDGWAYEPKYDGFRALAFVDGEDVFLQSRNGRPLARYFPELVFPKGNYVLDGELVILDDGGREVFDALQNRLHPAESRVKMLAEQTPAIFRAFDVLAIGDETAMGNAFSERRAALEKLVEGFKDPGSVELTPISYEPEDAKPWLTTGEGVIAKRVDFPYLPGERKAMVKVKRVRTIDAVVMGWRPGKEESTVGSLILGLYDDKGQLHVVGHTSGLKAKEKRELIDKLAPYASGEKGSADPSRWSADRDLEWVGLRPELVIEVAFDHVSAGRIRHGSKILRWREDKQPQDCKLQQLDQ